MKEDKESETIDQHNDGIHNDEEFAANMPDHHDKVSEGNAKKRTSRGHQLTPKAAVADTHDAHHRKKEPVSSKAILIKYTALLLLVAQMVGLVLIMRYSRTTHDPDQPLYLASTAVFIMEVMKLVVCLAIVAYQANGAIHQELYQHVIQSPMEIVKLTVPSVLYTIQNNLLYLALTNLDAATYQVCYQLKATRVRMLRLNT